MGSFCIQSKNLTKIADSTVLVNHVDFTAWSGEIHAVIGNNGEGKTVFAELLAGVRKKTSGSILLDGKELHITDVRSAQDYGIFMLHQQQILFPGLSIRDNIIAGNEHYFCKSHIWKPSRKEMDAVCQQHLDNLGFHFDLDAPIASLNSMEILIVQLCRILICHPKVIILDEPSAALTSTEWGFLFDHLETIKQQTVILVITHNFPLLQRYCDRVSIINNGTITGSFSRDEFHTDDFRKYIESMNLNFTYPAISLEPGAEIMRIDHLHTDTLEDVHFSLHEGEIIGIAGLTTSERALLIEAILGKRKDLTASISFPHHEERPAINVVSSQEADKGLFLSQSIPFNITVSDLEKTVKHGITSANKMRIYAAHSLSRLRMQGITTDTKVKHLSTGNKQKLIIARSLFNQSNIYLYDEPSKNLDASSKLDLYNILNALALEGASILLISSDYSELVGICRRVIVLKDGRQTGNYSTKYLSADALSKELE